MNAAIDEVSADQLIGEQEPTCIFLVCGVTCGQPAAHRTKCTHCGAFTGLVCSEHGRQLLQSVRVVTHSSCGGRGAYCDMVQVVPL